MRKVDFWLAFFAVLLALFGLVMIFEASNIDAFRDFGDKYHYAREQLRWFVLGVIGMVVISRIPYKNYYYLAVPLLVGAIILLFAVFLPGIGIHTLGASRWVGIGPVRLQPSEFMKLTLVIYLASWLSTKEKGRMLAFLLLLGLIVGLVVLQPDLGTSIILTTIFFVMYFVSGVPLRQIALLLPLLTAGIVLLAVSSPYRFQRLMTFVNLNHDPLGSSYHIRQALIAFGSGGLWGVGLGQSRQKYQFLPEATTDSIFAIVGEEFGFLGATLFITFMAIFLYKIFDIARNAPDRQSMLLASGILALFGFQIIINLGAMVVIFPLTGIPLPFISYGGSSLLVSMAAVGILLNISSNIKRQ